MKTRLALISPLVLVAVLLTGAVQAYGDPIVAVPPGLLSGDHYRLVFVTSSTRDATSSLIADYNQLVADAANSIAILGGLGTTWRAIASTDAVDAVDNIGTDGTTPIYDLNGELVANSLYAVFNPPFSIRSIATNEHGVFYDGRVWTGSGRDGRPVSLPDGTTYWALGKGNPIYGETTGSNRIDSGVPGGNRFLYPLYGISATLTVPESNLVPEPTSLLLFGTGLVGLRAWRKRRQ